jgi:hypothetical protein
LPKAEGTTTSGSWEDMRSNDSCSDWATQPTATDSQSRGQRCLRPGRVTPTAHEGSGPAQLGSSAIREVEETIRAICKVEWNDGILFDGESVEGTRINAP